MTGPNTIIAYDLANALITALLKLNTMMQKAADEHRDVQRAEILALKDESDKLANEIANS